MSSRVPFDNLPLGRSNVPDPLSPLLSLVQGCGGIQATAQSHNENASTVMTLRKVLGEPATEKLSEKNESDNELSDVSVASDEAPESADDEDDVVARALAFAKMRAAYAGMSTAMSNFNAAIQQSDEEEQNHELSALASEVISSISRSPPSLERHMSISSKWSDESEDDNLSDTQREECLMVKDYTERWANNIRLASTYWQGFTPLHLNVSVSLAQRLIVYRAEQAIKHASDQLELPPPIEFERRIPRLSRDPVHIGFAGPVEGGNLFPRPLPTGYSPQKQLEELRVAFNNDCAKDNKVETVAVRLQAGAKRAAGTQRPKEAQAVRNVWVRAPSRLYQDVSSWLVAEDGSRS
ncbi:hypothetical protein C8Q80DRAFT_1120262 [Daedaleopsis nitida]|nr:hypothetical protein C8Q80DRAFT_1120262 [Daedaleopsis nitida]